MSGSDERTNFAGFWYILVQKTPFATSSQMAGFKSVQWNATNYTNEPVPAGMYIDRIETDKFRQIKKMVLLK